MRTRSQTCAVAHMRSRTGARGRGRVCGLWLPKYVAANSRTSNDVHVFPRAWGPRSRIHVPELRCGRRPALPPQGTGEDAPPTHLSTLSPSAPPPQSQRPGTLLQCHRASFWPEPPLPLSYGTFKAIWGPPGQSPPLKILDSVISAGTRD